MKRIASLLCLLCVAWHVALAAPSPSEKLDLDATVLPSVLPGEFEPVQFAVRVSNHGMFPMKVDLVYQEYRRNQVKLRMTRSAFLTPGSSTVLRFYRVESGSFGNPDFQVYVNGKYLDSPFAGLQMASLYKRSNNTLSSILVGGGLPVELVEYVSFPDRRLVMASPIPLSQWSEDPKDYFSWQGHEIWLSPKDVLPDGVKRALLEWVRAGGQLVYVYLADDPWPEELPGRLPGEHIQKLGLGRVVHFRMFAFGNKAGLNYRTFLEKWKELNETHPNPKGKKVSPGEEFMTHSPEFLEAMRTPSIQSVYGSYHGAWQIFGLFEPKVPLTLLLVMMILFSVLVFPLSHWYYRRKGNVLMLLVSTPACSFLFCLLILLVITFSDGWRIRTSTMGITYLDQAERLAVTEAHLSLLAPYVPTSDFQFDREDRLSIHLDHANEETIVLADQPGQCLHPRIVTPRRPLNLHTKRLEHRGERLRVIEVDGGLEVVNGLGAEVEALCLVRENGERLVAPLPIPAGGRARLVPALEWKPKQLPDGTMESDIVGTNPNDHWIDQMLSLCSNSCRVEEANRSLDVDKLFASLPKSCDGFQNMFCAVLRKPVFYSPGFQGKMADNTQIVFGPWKAE
ncbi:MAG: hypothetical protein IJJ26_09595 [Victivallales bacterium]|nr:hypothetical protein [Victivallales bacterium]